MFTRLALGGNQLSTSSVTVIVPTFNESANVAELVRRVKEALSGLAAKILFVDDSPDDQTFYAVQEARAAHATDSLEVAFAKGASRGLSAAVIDGMRIEQRAGTPVVVVMDGDLQHPPETIPDMLRRLSDDCDIVPASRYCQGGSSEGLSGPVRQVVSLGSHFVSKVLFPKALSPYTDLMTGFFCVNLGSINLDILQPRGFKILLEIILRHISKEGNLRAAEVPLVFGKRNAGTSKSTLLVGMKFIRQLVQLRRSLPVFQSLQPRGKQDARMV